MSVRNDEKLSIGAAQGVMFGITEKGGWEVLTGQISKVLATMLRQGAGFST